MNIPKPFNYFYHIVLFLMILFFMDYLVGSVCKKEYFARTHGLLYGTTYSLDSTKSDVIVLGSSRANHHYVPSIFEDSLHLSCYNTGRDACLLIYQLAVMKCIIARYTPKVVIYDLIPYEFLNTHDSYDRLSFLLPYYKTHPEIRSILKKFRNFEDLKMISNIYPYNSSVFYLGRNNPNELIEEHHKKGFVESYREWNFPRTVEKETNDAFEYNQKKLDAYKELLTICKTKHIKLYVVVSPYYEDINNRLKKMIQITKTIAAEQQIDFFDHSQDTTFTNHGFLFSDVSHLNGKGAQIFSKIIAGKIKEQSKNITSTLANNK